MNLEILLKDIFEKCWHQHSVLLKLIACLIYLLYNLITFLNLFRTHFERYYDKIENVLKNHNFWYLSKQNSDVIKFLLAPRLQKVCDWIYNKLSYMHTTFHDPNSSRSNRSNLVGVMILPTPWAVIDQKSLGQIVYI